MNRHYYYKKTTSLTRKHAVRFFGAFFSLVGIGILGYVLTPLILWEIFLAPAFATDRLTYPIPSQNILTPSTIRSLMAVSQSSLDGTNYLDSSTWFPTYNESSGKPKVPSYFLSIPKIHIKNAVISTEDTNLAKHLISIAGSVVPPDLGSAIIFGHSTLPQLFNASDYKTIFSPLYLLSPGDVIIATVGNVSYTYKIMSIHVVDPGDTSLLIQQRIDSTLILVTCTPPGTIWKRLVISASLTKI